METALQELVSEQGAAPVLLGAHKVMLVLSNPMCAHAKVGFPAWVPTADRVAWT